MKFPEVPPQVQRENHSLMTLLILILALAVRPAALAQGTLRFANLADGVNAPFYFPGGVTKLGTNCVSVLYAGPTPTSYTQLASAQFGGMTPYGTNCPPGYFDGGVIYVPTVAGGGVAYGRIDIWGTYSFEVITVPEKCVYRNQGPLFTNVLGGDSTSPAVLSAFGNGPIILGFTQLALHAFDTNTLTFSVINPSSQFALSSYIGLEQSPTLNNANWVPLGLPSWPACSEIVIPRPSATRFYRLQPAF